MLDMGDYRTAIHGNLTCIFLFLNLFLSIFLAFCPWPVFASENSGQPMSIEANQLSYDWSGEVVRAEGDVHIVYSGNTLSADQVSYNRQSGNATATGNVKLLSGADVLEGRRAEVNVDEKIGTLYQGYVFMARNHFYLRGDKIEKTGENTYFVQDSDATTCDGADPAWHLYGHELNVTIEGYGTLKDARFMVGSEPIFYLPYMIFPAKTTRQSGFLLPDVSYSTNKLGWDVELPFFYAISDQMDATFYERYMDKRGFKQGAEFRYAFSADSFGTLYGDYLEDRMQIEETNGNLFRDWQPGRQRWSYYLNNQTVLSKDFYIRTDLVKVSDAWYFQDFNSNNYYLNHYGAENIDPFKQVPFKGDETLGSLESKMRAVKEWDTLNLTTLVRYTDDFTSSSNSGTAQKYPEVTLTAIRQPFLRTPMQYAFQTSYDYYYRQVGQKGSLYQIEPVLMLPISLHGMSTVTPFIDYREAYWNRDDATDSSTEDQGHRGVFSTGLLWDTELRRTFQASIGNIDKIQHIVRPEIAYTYSTSEGDGTIPDFAPPLFSEHSITYAVINVLTARDHSAEGAVSYREWMRLKLAQTYYIQTSGNPGMPTSSSINYIKNSQTWLPVSEADTKPFGDVQIELDVTPLDFLSFSSRNLYNVEKESWDQTNCTLNLKDRRGDTLSAGYSYTVDTAEEVDLSLTSTLRNDLFATFILRQDLRDQLGIEQTYKLRYQKQCWSVEASYSETLGDRSFNVLVSLYGLGRSGSK